jgi:sulfur carrier protein ThiS
MELLVDNKIKKISLAGDKDSKTKTTGAAETDVSLLLKKLGISQEEAIVKINSKLAPETTKIRPSDKVEVIRVVFGG